MNELLNDPVRASTVTMAFEERYKYIRSQVFMMLPQTISGIGQLRKYPRKSCQWYLCSKSDCVTSMRLAYKYHFLFRNRMAELFCITFDYYHLSNFSTRTLSVLLRPDPCIPLQLCMRTSGCHA